METQPANAEIAIVSFHAHVRSGAADGSTRRRSLTVAREYVAGAGSTRRCASIEDIPVSRFSTPRRAR